MHRNLYSEKEIANNLKDLHCARNSCAQEVIACTAEILDANYKKVGVPDVAGSSMQLSYEEQSK